MKVMAAGLPGGTSFMEDYTYHLDPGRTAGPRRPHAGDLPVDRRRPSRSCEIHPLGIGGKEDPVRLVFDAPPGPAIDAASSTWATAFRLVVNEIDVVAPPQPLPKLPVARAVWQPRPSSKRRPRPGSMAGGPHHTGFSQAIDSSHRDFAEIAGIELISIDADTTDAQLSKELRWSQAYYHLAGNRRDADMTYDQIRA